MAYNPFDDVILDDPAYMQIGGGVQRSVIPQRRVDASVQEPGFKPVASLIAGAYKLLTPEQETLDQIEKDQQLRSLATAQAFTGTEFEKFAGQFDLPSSVLQNQKALDLLNQAGFNRESFTEGISRAGQFLYGNQRQAFDKLKSGEQLTSDDRLSIALAPLDSLDFLLPPVALKKLAGIGLKNINQVLKSTSDLPEVRQIKQLFGGEPLPAIGRADGPPGMDTGPRIALSPADEGARPGVSVTQQKRLDEQKKETLKLADILKKDLEEDKNLTIRQLVEKYKLKGITLKDRTDLKNTSRAILMEEVPELYKAKTALSQKNIGLQKGRQGDEQLFEYLKKKRESGEKFESFTKIAEDLVSLKETIPGLKVVNRKSLTKRYKENPEFAELFDQIIERPEKIQAATDRFQEAFLKVPLDNRLKLIGEEAIKDINPQMFDSITRLSGEAGKKGVTDANKLFRQFLYDKYRSIKESKNPQGIVTEDDFFTKLKLTDKDIQDLKSEFSDYAMLERDRLYMQKEGLNFMNRLLENPQYRPYLINPETGKVDQKLFTVNKLHDVPLFEARKEGKGRLKKVGRFLNTGTDPEFLNPHFQPYNRLMVDFDPTLNKLADILNQKGLMKRASIMNAEVIPKIVDKAGNYQTPKSRINFITQGIVNLINNKGFNLNPAGKKQDVFLLEVAEAIDDIYKERGLRAVVPTLKGAKKESQIFGVENPKAIDLDTKIDQYKEALLNALNYAVENKISPQDFRTKPKREKGLGYIKSLKTGGPVRMAIGGDPLQNINQQQFMPDPAFEGEDFFKEAVDSGNLTAFNPTKLFKVFGKVDAVETPKKKIQTDAPQAPPGTTLPAAQQMQPSDFAFKSFTLDVITDPNAPKAARPQDWMNFFKGKAAPEAELRDTGLMQFLEDYAKYYPNQKLTQQRLVDFYEQSPMGNISIKVKQDGTNVPADPAFLDFVGRPRHKNTGNQDLDRVGENYREVLVQAGPLPGETKPFVASAHFEEENVIGFTRVADYENVNGQPVAVIQELQTDMLTQVRKEQERIQALLKRIENIRARAQRQVDSGDTFDSEMGKRALRELNSEFPTATIQKLQENLSAIKPFPNTAGLERVPQFSKELSDIQKQINALIDVEVKSPNPQTPFALETLENQQQTVLNNLLDLTRNTELETDLKGLSVPSSTETDELIRFGEKSDNMNTAFGGFKELQLFPPVPFNKQPDYVDLLVKATIKDAQSKGINKVAIMPAEKVNQRWGKDPDGPAGVKFKNLYDKVVPQQLNNIAKKYNGNVSIEQIVDKNKLSTGLKMTGKNVDGQFELLRDIVPSNREGADEFLSDEILRIVGDYGPNDVVVRREVAPGQTMEFFASRKKGDGTLQLTPLVDADRAENATIIIEEYNPQIVDMVTITLDSPKAEQPFFMFKKKDGGTIAKDSLVSVTDIFGEYGSR